MRKAKANYDYINEFNEKNYDRIFLVAPKGTKERISSAAKEVGKSTNEFILDMLPRALVGKWKKKSADAEA